MLRLALAPPAAASTNFLAAGVARDTHRPQRKAPMQAEERVMRQGPLGWLVNPGHSRPRAPCVSCVHGDDEHVLNLKVPRHNRRS